MVELSVKRGCLVVRFVGLDRLWACAGRLSFPLEHVLGARVDPDVESEGPWLGAGGDSLVTLGWAVAAGPMCTTRRDGRKTREFWDVHRPDRAIAVDLIDEPYSRLVLDVHDPAHAVTFVQRHVMNVARTA